MVPKSSGPLLERLPLNVLLSVVLELNFTDLFMESVIVVITFWYVQFCPDRLFKTSAMFTHSKLINILILIFASILNETFLYAPYLTFLMLKVNSQICETFCSVEFGRICHLRSIVLPITTFLIMLLINGGRQDYFS